MSDLKAALRNSIHDLEHRALARIEELEGRLAKAVMGLQRIDAEARDAAAMAEAGYRVSAGTVAVAAYEVSTATLSSIQDKTDD